MSKEGDQAVKTVIVLDFFSANVGVFPQILHLAYEVMMRRMFL